MIGRILNIQRFCTQDGPGIRTTVFFKGCPLKCVWCHNPESQAEKCELMYDADNCVNCLRCIPACPQKCHIQMNGKHRINRADCLSCGKCTSLLCRALELSGREMTAGEVLAEVLKDQRFYKNSGGGLTVSGGEPLFQFPFCAELLQMAKKHDLHVCMETCGFTDPKIMEESAAWVDLYLFDYKETDPVKHREYTGVDQTQILENLYLLDAMGKSIILRCPIIPGCNDRQDHFIGIAHTANRLHNPVEIVIEPYHTLGTGKYRKLGREYALPQVCPPERETVNRWVGEIQKYTSVKVRPEL